MILHVVGTRPNYVKVAPVWHALSVSAPRIAQRLVDTGQHHDDRMAGVFRRELGLPTPDWSLGVRSHDRASQIAGVVEAFADVCQHAKPDLVVVVGDVNSTLGAAAAAAAMGIPVAHVEAGLRSHDDSMPEELNRIATDRLADILLTPSRDAGENLEREGIASERIHFVGNVMIDTLVRHLPDAPFERVRARWGLNRGEYAVCTLHRPSNVDRPDTLAGLLDAVARLARRLPVVFPIHPRTRDRIEAFGLSARLDAVRVSEPLGYLDFLSLMRHARLVVTDSGGLQEESVFIGVPCVTVRTSTERPVTLAGGANRLVDPESDAIVHAAEAALASPTAPLRPELWDGRAAFRIADVLKGAIADAPRGHTGLVAGASVSPSH